MRKLFDSLVINFGFNDYIDFSQSLIHTKFLWFTIPFSIIVTSLQYFSEKFLGLYIITFAAFFILLILELITGIVASKIKGHKIESRKFSRFGLKVFVWICVVFVVQSLKLQYEKNNSIIYSIYSGLHTFILGYINMEYLISVIENLGVITNKKYTVLIDQIKQKLIGGSYSQGTNTKSKKIK